MCFWLTGTSALDSQPAVAKQKMARAEVSPIVTVWMLIWGSSQLPGDQKNCSNDVVVYNIAEMLFTLVTAELVGQVRRLQKLVFLRKQG